MAYLIKRTPRPHHTFGSAHHVVSATAAGHDNAYFTADVVGEFPEFSETIRGAGHYETPPFVAALVANSDGSVRVVVGPLLDRATYGVQMADRFSFAYGWELDYGVTRGCMRPATDAEIAEWHARRAEHVRNVEASNEAKMFANADRMGDALARGQIEADRDL